MILKPALPWRTGTVASCGHPQLSWVRYRVVLIFHNLLMPPRQGRPRGRRGLLSYLSLN